ncbi:DUF5906 domain-containing protein [Sorangium sp. So ce834]|uniref:DUF5906 domain-containing protein n=1 Tax=Sorangium sp. So ce834 TaxID=3133321 RepID=UPI003F630D7F
MLFGEGGNGKSAGINLVRAMFPPEALASLPPQRWTERFALSAPEGKLANFVSKTPSGERLEGGAFKAVVTGDPVMAERKHREGELAVDLLKDVEILAPPGIDRGRCKQGRDALQVCPGGIIGRVVRAYEVDSLAEVRDRPCPEPRMHNIASNQMTGMAFIEPSGNTLPCRGAGLGGPVDQLRRRERGSIEAHDLILRRCSVFHRSPGGGGE